MVSAAGRRSVADERSWLQAPEYGALALLDHGEAFRLHDHGWKDGLRCFSFLSSRIPFLGQILLGIS